MVDTPSDDETAADEQPVVVWIVGGGLAGLATAAALRKICGYKVYILELQSSDDYYNVHAGAVAKIGPNGFKALQVLDETLPNRLIEHGQVLHGIKSPDLTIKDTSLEQAGWPQILISWGLLRHFLQQLVPSDIILNGIGQDICGYRIDESTNKVVLVNQDNECIQMPKQYDIESPDWIVAADGVNSPFQSLVRMKSTILRGPDAPAIRRSNLHDNGRVNINAVVGQPLHVPRGTVLSYMNDRYTCFCISLGERWTSLAVSIADTLQDDGSLVQYFCHSTVANPEAQKEFLRQLLRDAPDYIQNLLQCLDTQHLFIRRSTQLTLIGPSFVSFDNKVVLVGDAAHNMSPSYGQQFNFGLEDAIVLAWAVCHNKNNLQLYSDTRVQRCEEMFRRSAERVLKKDLSDDTVLRWIDSWEPPPMD